jgi:PAS domain S-box-containing protein
MTALGIYACQFRKIMASSLPFALMMGLLAMSSLFFTMEIASNGLAEKIFWRKMFFIPTPLMIVVLLTMVLQHTRQSYLLNRVRWVALLAIPIVTVFLNLTSDYQNLFRYNYHIDTIGPLPVLDWTNGPWFWIYIDFTYALGIAALALLMWSLRNNPYRRYRRQTILIAAAILLPFVADMLFVFLRISLIPGLSSNPSANALSGIIITWAIFQYHLLDRGAIARGILVETAKDPMIVFDNNDSIIDLNRAARENFDLDDKGVLGQPAAILLSRIDNELLKSLDPSIDGKIVTMGGEKSNITYEISFSPINDRNGYCIGRMMVLHDISQLEKAKLIAQTQAAQLANANAQLEIEVSNRKNAEEEIKSVKNELEKVLKRRTSKLQMQTIEQMELEKKLQKLASRYRAIVEDQETMILRYLSDGTITYANDAFCNYIDKSIDLLIGSSLLSLIHEDDRERAADFLESVTANKLPIFKGAVRIITSQGETRWLEQTSKPILGKHGEIVEFQVIGRDATTQIETGEAILGVPGETSSIVEGGCV